MVSVEQIQTSIKLVSIDAKLSKLSRSLVCMYTWNYDDIITVYLLYIHYIIISEDIKMRTTKYYIRQAHIQII